MRYDHSEAKRYVAATGWRGALQLALIFLLEKTVANGNTQTITIERRADR